MKTSIVNSSKVDLGDRIDAEYFEVSYLENEDKLKKVNGKPLSNYCKLVSSAFYPAATDLYSIGEIPFIRCVDCIEYPAITSLQNETFEKLPLFFIKDNKTIKLLKKEDIVITKVGTPCYASIIRDIEEVALSRTVLGLYKIKGIDPFYLTVYLRSKYGYEQLFRERELTIQYQLTLERVGRILIYEPVNESFEKQIRQVFLVSQRLSMQAVEQYKEAEQILLSELGLLDWKPQHQLSFTKHFSDTKSSARIDAEYFQPMYEEIIRVVTKICEAKPIGQYEFIHVTTGQYAEDYCDRTSGLPYIRGTDLLNGTVNMDGLVYISRESQDKAKLAKEGDVVVTRVGTIGLSARIPKECEGGTISDNLIRLRVIGNEINSYYLALFLDSVLGRSLMTRNSRGSVQQRLNQETLKEIIVPLLNKDVQQNIASKVQEAHKRRSQSKNLLEIAKRGVEIAIEKNEEEAQNWINQEVKSLCLTIT